MRADYFVVSDIEIPCLTAAIDQTTRVISRPIGT
jgi:hypothetical protein